MFLRRSLIALLSVSRFFTRVDVTIVSTRSWKDHLPTKVRYLHEDPHESLSFVYVNNYKMLAKYYILQVESLSKKYEEKYKQTGDVASKLTIEEATFRDIQVTVCH